MRIPGYRQTGQPSKLQNVTHIWAFHPDYRPEIDTNPYGGKWLVFVDASQVDALWKAIKNAVETQRLGEACKVSSAGLANRSRTREYLICVYTPDFRERDDVFRAREALRSIGITWPINYKSSEWYRLLEQGYMPEEIDSMHPASYYYKYRS